MLTKNQLKLYTSLQNKKNRKDTNLFIAEGRKIVSEAINSDFKIEAILATKQWISNNIFTTNINIIESTQSEINKLSSLTTPTDIMAVIEIPKNDIVDLNLKNKLTIVLDNIGDPGNLGTIIRLADWFGIENIVCSDNSVDQYNSKVVQATMGSIFRTKVYYTNLFDFLKKASEIKNFNIYGTYLEGENIYNQKLKNEGIIMFGSESHGISENLADFVKHKLNIPSFNNSKTESLNISIATSIVCSEFRRTK